MLKNQDLVILVNPKGKRYLRRVTAGEELHNNDGTLPWDDVLAAGYGGVVRTRQGQPYKILRPGLHDLVKGVKRQTQIIYPKDISYLCLRLGAGNGRRIIEAGSGSGSLTLALSWFSGEQGQVYTYEARSEFFELCGKNLAWAGLGHNVTRHHRDIAQGFLEKDVDALFLDVRTPWEYLDQALAALKLGGQMAFLVPTVDQLSKLLRAFETRPIDEPEVLEIMIRRWKPVADRLRPEDRMIAHTGFLVFALKQEQCAEWDALRPLGTRERKQEAAREARLAAGQEDHAAVEHVAFDDFTTHEV